MAQTYDTLKYDTLEPFILEQLTAGFDPVNVSYMDVS
jgi:hypothetical protein